MKRYKSERFLIGVFEIIELSRLVAQKFDSAVVHSREVDSV